MRTAGIGKLASIFRKYISRPDLQLSPQLFRDYSARLFCATILMNGEFHTAASRLRALRAALVGCRSQVVPGQGAAPATVAFVGLAPGRLGGDRTGIPFSGDRSGELLRL